MDDVSLWAQPLSRIVVKSDFSRFGFCRFLSEYGLILPHCKPGAAASGSSPAGTFTGEAGFMAYYEICDKINNNGWTEVYDSNNMKSAYAYGDGIWCGYENLGMSSNKIIRDTCNLEKDHERSRMRHVETQNRFIVTTLQYYQQEKLCWSNVLGYCSR